MHNTIWLLAFRRQLLATKLGSFIRITTIPNPKLRKKNRKNLDLISNENKEPNNITNNGNRIENDITPAGVTFRCAICTLSVISCHAFLPGFIFRSFSLRLHSFSYILRCLGMYSSLNSWYSLDTIFRFSILVPSSFSIAFLYS